MRLIDADALLEQDVFRDNRETDYHENKGVTKAACAIIDAPTIDAIPIEWLKELAQNQRDCDCPSLADFIDRMIGAWRCQSGDNSEGVYAVYEV